MAREGASRILVRDRAGGLHCPARFPYAGQGAATGQLIRHIEQLFCVTGES